MSDNQDPDYQASSLPQKAKKIKKSGGFESMNLIYPVYRAIKQKGFNLPTPIQRKSIPLIIQGRDLVACSRTGSGKTAAFVIPIINKLQKHNIVVGTRCLIIVPSRELAIQTAQVMKLFIKFTDLIYTLLVGGHGVEGQFESLASNPDIIIATPGRLQQLLIEKSITLTKVEILIFDEADLLFEQGFSEQIHQIIGFVPGSRQICMFSATIPEELSQFARVGLKDYAFVKLDSEYTLSQQMSLNFIISRSLEKLADLVFILNQWVQKDELVIIFASTKYHVDFIHSVLNKIGFKAVGIYGQMDQQARKEQLEKFKRNIFNILVVTDLASRGLDIPFVSVIIHYDFPQNIKTFIHRSGRTARAGKTGTIYSLITVKEIMYIQEILLHVGRKLSSSVDDLNDTNKAIYGLIPIQFVNKIVEQLGFLIDEDIEIRKMKEIADRAFKKFLKSRVSASKASIRNCYLVNLNAVHPKCKENKMYFEAVESEQKILEELKNYKPTQTYLEIYQTKGMSAKERTVLKGSGFFKAVENIKKIEEYENSKRKQKFQLKELQEKLQNELKIQDQTLEGAGETNGASINQTEAIKTEATKTEADTKNRKRSQSVGVQRQKKYKDDYRHPTQFIGNEKEKTNTFQDCDKIQMEDINTCIIAEDYEGLLKNKSKYKWDGKRYKVDSQQNNNEKKKLKNIENKKVAFQIMKKWKQKTKLHLQKEGEIEDTQISQQARELFKKRRLKSKGFHYTEDQAFSGKGNRPGKNEIKNRFEMIKGQKKQKKLKFKNLTKNAKKQSLGKGGKFNKK